MSAKEIVLKTVQILYRQFKANDEKDMIEFTGRVHHLKTWPGPFEEIRARRKTAEFRQQDRDFQVSHFLVLEEFDPKFKFDKFTGDGTYTGRKIICIITHIQTGFGIPEGFCMLSLNVLSEAQ